METAENVNESAVSAGWLEVRPGKMAEFVLLRCFHNRIVTIACGLMKVICICLKNQKTTALEAGDYGMMRGELELKGRKGTDKPDFPALKRVLFFF